MSIAQQVKMDELERRIAALEQMMMNALPAPVVSGDPPLQKTGSTLTLPEKRKSA